jgi:TPR repeat protein
MCFKQRFKSARQSSLNAGADACDYRPSLPQKIGNPADHFWRRDMARFDIHSETACMTAGTTLNAEAFFDLGIQHCTGRAGNVDLVAAHKWFNIAAAKGYGEAARMRSEVAAEMSQAAIAEAQRAARTFLSLH